MTDLLVMVPTRGRRAQCERLLEAFTATASPDTDLLFITDPDDESYEGMDWRAAGLAVLEPREYLTGKLNKTAMAMADLYPVLMWLGDDCVPETPGWDQIMLATLAELGGSGWVYPDDKRRNDVPEHYMVSSDVVKTLGWFANPAVQHYYCLVPETPVLTASLEWVPIGKLSVGDELVGVDEFAAPRSDRKYRRATVLATPRRQAECVMVCLEDGREVTCSEQHMWLVHHPLLRYRYQSGLGKSSYGWVEASQLRPGDRIASPMRTWETETSFEAGWLSGMFDGEGTSTSVPFSRDGKTYYNSFLAVAQNPGPVLDRMEAILTSMDIGYLHAKRHAKVDDCVVLNIRPRSHMMELLGRLQTTRLNRSAVWEGGAIRARESNATLATVTEVRPVGTAEVVSLKTSTKTFLANGLVSHNCDNSVAELGKRAGLIRWCPEAVIRHEHYSVNRKTRRDRLYSQTEKKFGASDLAAFQEWLGNRAKNEVSVLRRHFSPDVAWVLSRVA